jgi:hypothetical protein
MAEGQWLKAHCYFHPAIATVGKSPLTLPAELGYNLMILF